MWRICLCVLLWSKTAESQIVANADGWEIGSIRVGATQGDYFARKRLPVSIGDYDESRPFMKPVVQVVCTARKLPATLGPTKVDRVKEPAIYIEWSSPRPSPGIVEALQKTAVKPPRLGSMGYPDRFAVFAGLLIIGGVEIDAPVFVTQINGDKYVRASVTLVGRDYVAAFAESMLNAGETEIALDGVSHRFDFTGIRTAAEFVSKHCG